MLSKDRLNERLNYPRAERIDENYNEIVGQLGGSENCTPIQLQLARRCAAILVQIAVWENCFARGEPVPTGTWGAAINTARRLLCEIGLSGRPRRTQPLPTLDEYLSEPDNDEATSIVDQRRAG